MGDFLIKSRDAKDRGPTITLSSLQIMTTNKLNQWPSDAGATFINQIDNGRYILVSLL